MVTATLLVNDSRFREHIELLLAARRFRAASRAAMCCIIRTVKDRYYQAREVILEGSMDDLLRFGDAFIWVRCQSCGEFDMRIRPNLETWFFCGSSRILGVRPVALRASSPCREQFVPVAALHGHEQVVHRAPRCSCAQDGAYERVDASVFGGAPRGPPITAEPG